MTGRFVRTVATLFTLLVGGGTWDVAAAQDGGLELGTVAPGAAVQTLDGKPVDLAAVIGKGQPAVIEFWATWCENCEELLPTWRAAEAKYRGKVKFVGVSVSVNQSVRRGQAAGAKHKGAGGRPRGGQGGGEREGAPPPRGKV